MACLASPLPVERVCSPGKQETRLSPQWRKKSLWNSFFFFMCLLFIKDLEGGLVLGKSGPLSFWASAFLSVEQRGFQALQASFSSDFPGSNGSCWSLEGAVGPS